MKDLAPQSLGNLNENVPQWVFHEGRWIDKALANQTTNDHVPQWVFQNGKWVRRVVDLENWKGSDERKKIFPQSN